MDNDRRVDLGLQRTISRLVTRMDAALAEGRFFDAEGDRKLLAELTTDRRLRNRRDGLSLGYTPDRRRVERRGMEMDGDE